MKAKAISFYEWQKQFSTHQKCLKHIAELRWPNGFQCPHCGHDHGYYINTRAHFECAQCHKNTSVTSGTLFHATFNVFTSKLVSYARVPAFYQLCFANSLSLQPLSKSLSVFIHH